MLTQGRPATRHFFLVAGELDRVADEKQRFIGVRSGHAVEHLMTSHVRVFQEIFRAEARTCGDPLLRELLGRFELRSRRSPLLDRGSDDGFDLIAPALAGGEALVVEHSGWPTALANSAR